MRLQVLACWALLGCGAAAWAADDLPLPHGVNRLAGPYEAMLGRRAVTMYAFQTGISVERIRAFYLQTLPRRKWRIEPLPWMAGLEENLSTAEGNLVQVEEQVAEADRLRVEHPEAVKDSDVASIQEQVSAIKEQVGQLSGRLQKTRQMNERTLHAVRGEEHVLFHFTRNGASTGVFINRWKGALIPAPSASGDAGLPAPPGGAWPMTNACCTGEVVPPAARKLPLSIPDYPEAKLIAVGSPKNSGIVSATFMSNGSVDDIVEFYRGHLSYNGWQELERPVKPVTSEASASLNSQLVPFKGEEGLCAIAVVEPSASLSEAMGAAPVPAPSADPIRAKTMIVITFIERKLVPGVMTHSKPKAVPDEMP